MSKTNRDATEALREKGLCGRMLNPETGDGFQLVCTRLIGHDNKAHEQTWRVETTYDQSQSGYYQQGAFFSSTRTTRWHITDGKHWYESTSQENAYYLADLLNKLSLKDEKV